MKWFQHYSRFSEDERVITVEQHYGLPGYARLVKIYEAVAGRMGSTDNCQMMLTWAQCENLLAGKRKSLQPYLYFLSKQQLIELVACEKKVTIKCPKLLKLKDNYSRNLQETDKLLASHPSNLPLFLPMPINGLTG